jgi:hypothetical protein
VAELDLTRVSNEPHQREDGCDAEDRSAWHKVISRRASILRIGLDEQIKQSGHQQQDRAYPKPDCCPLHAFSLSPIAPDTATWPRFGAA